MCTSARAQLSLYVTAVGPVKLISVVAAVRSLSSYLSLAIPIAKLLSSLSSELGQWGWSYATLAPSSNNFSTASGVNPGYVVKCPFSIAFFHVALTGLNAA